MSSKVQPITEMEETVPIAITTTASTSSTTSPKVSLFAKKSGFVIPKNKLSGSLVPIFRGSKKPGGAEVEDNESTKQVLRKTKWGPDLTQDAFVKKGRASAYQTRLDQITQQLNSGIMEPRDDNEESHGNQNIEKSELELERREVIGEILKLNPTYKAPSDYKPLLKEEKVSIPIKEHPGRNFIGLIFGPAGDTKKRLEKETGGKIRVYGTKSDTKKKIEISTSDSNENHGDYEELYVLVTAETYEKVDAAVSLIELLITPVAANTVAISTNDPVSENSPNVVSVDQDNKPVVVNTGSRLVPPLAWLQPYPNQWVPTGQQSGFITPSNSAPMMTSSFNPRIVMSRPRGSVPYNQMPNMGHVGPPRNPSLPPIQIQPSQPNFSPGQPFTATGPNQNMRPIGSPIPRSGPIMSSVMQPTVRPQTPLFRPTVRPPNPRPNSWFISPTTQPQPVTALRPPQRSSNDFTFQTQIPQVFHPGMNNQGFIRPPTGQQIGQHRAMAPPPDRQPVFPSHGSRPPPNHMGPRQFGPGSTGSPFGPRPAVQPSMGFRPVGQQFRGNVSLGFSRSGGPQVYDPFSPSAVPQNAKKQDSDPEYDDLMASVGVK